MRKHQRNSIRFLDSTPSKQPSLASGGRGGLGEKLELAREKGTNKIKKRDFFGHGNIAIRKKVI
jgi:hypothetical protein